MAALVAYSMLQHCLLDAAVAQASTPLFDNPDGSSCGW
jgi:hypothetical protein